MTESPIEGSPQEFDAEDRKLLTLARASKARTGAAQGAAVRDGDGRTYAASSVGLPSLSLSALQVAVAMAVSSGAPGIEAAVVVAAADAGAGDAAGDPAGRAAVADISAGAPVYFVDEAGARRGAVG